MNLFQKKNYKKQKTNNHLKQGTIGQSSKVFDRLPDKWIIFAALLWLGQINGIIFIVTVCLPIVQGGWQNKNN